MVKYEEADTIKFSTVVYAAFGILLPFWPITLPLFFWLAWRSYKRGGLPQVSLHELTKAKALLDEGGITQEEYDSLKSRTTQLGDR